MNKEEFKELDIEQMIIAFNQLKDDYSSLFNELEQQKEKNKELEKQAEERFEVTMELIGANYIHKDKIKEKIKEIQRELEILEKQQDNSIIYSPRDICNAEILRLKELLEGE